MTTAADPTVRTLDRFSDSTRWVVEENVPVFDAHDETDAAGAIVRQFGLKELREIADNCNRREIESGDACPITLGHTREGAPETDQPPIVGYARKFKVGRFGPQKKLAVLCTMYIRKDRYQEAMEYPRRSVELWMQERILDPIALLKRTPKRDLGLLTYKRNRLCYSMEDHTMPEPAPESHKPEHVHADMTPVPHPHPDYPAEHAHLEHAHEAVHHVMHYLAHHPVFKHAHHHMGGSEHHMAGAAGPGMASGSNTFTPGMTHHTPVQHMYQKETSSQKAGSAPVSASSPASAEQERVQQTQRDIELARYQREAEESKAALASLQQQVATMQRETRLAKYERELGHLLSQGYELDLAEELKEVGDYSAEQFSKHCERVKRHYRRKPLGGGFLPVARDAQEGGKPGPAPITKDERDQAIRLASAVSINGQDNEHYGKFDSALKYIRERNGAVKS